VFVFNVIKFYIYFFLPLFYYCAVYILCATNYGEIKVFQKSILNFGRLKLGPGLGLGLGLAHCWSPVTTCDVAEVCTLPSALQYCRTFVSDENVSGGLVASRLQNHAHLDVMRLGQHHVTLTTLSATDRLAGHAPHAVLDDRQNLRAFSHDATTRARRLSC